MPKHTRGAVTLVFDDGYTGVYQNVVPLLAQHSVPGVFAVALDSQAIKATENRPVTPWTTWCELTKYGHEIAAHSVSHRNLTNLSDEELATELSRPAQTLAASTLVYPGGAHDERVMHEAAKHYRAARTTVKGFERKKPTAPMQLKTYNFTRHNFSPWRANALVLWAWLTDGWLIETYHLVDNSETEKKHAVRLTDFAAHLTFIKKLPVAKVTIKTMTS